jgi:hypothetical protein
MGVIVIKDSTWLDGTSNFNMMRNIRPLLLRGVAALVLGCENSGYRYHV